MSLPASDSYFKPQKLTKYFIHNKKFNESLMKFLISHHNKMAPDHNEVFKIKPSIVGLLSLSSIA